MAWSKNNKAHTALYFVASYIHLHRNPGAPKPSFDVVGTWPVRYLIDYRAGDSAALEKQKAENTGIFFCGMFEGFYRAKSETGIPTKDIETAFAAHLEGAGNTVTSFADVVDDLYLFEGENI